MKKQKPTPEMIQKISNAIEFEDGTPEDLKEAMRFIILSAYGDGMDVFLFKSACVSIAFQKILPEAMVAQELQ